MLEWHQVARALTGVVGCALQRRCGMQRSLPELALFTVVGCLMTIEASAQVVRQEVPGVRNYATIESTVACAGAITPAAIREIKKMGYASIINLRLAKSLSADHILRSKVSEFLPRLTAKQHSAFT